MYYYMVRNNYINTKTYYSKIRVIKFVLIFYIQIFKILFSNSKHKFLKIKTIIRGLIHAQFRKYDYKAFKNRLKS